MGSISVDIEYDVLLFRFLLLIEIAAATTRLDTTTSCATTTTTTTCANPPISSYRKRAEKVFLERSVPPESLDTRKGSCNL